MKTELRAAGPLPPEEPHGLPTCIEAANHLLRTLGGPNPGDLRFLRFALQHRVGQDAEASLACGGEQRPRVVAGKVRMAGRDFLELTARREVLLIPYRQLCAVRWRLGHKGTAPKAPLHPPIDLDPLLKRRLILRFGEVVAEDKALMDRFFGIPLRRRLQDFLGRAVRVQTNRPSGTQMVYGVLAAVEEALEVQSGPRLERVGFEEICLIRL